FVLAVADIPRMNQRFKAMLYKLNFNDMVRPRPASPAVVAVHSFSLYDATALAHALLFQFSQLQDRLSLFEDAFTCVSDSVSLQRFLQYALAAGNFLNYGTNRSNVYGFKLSTLGKLSSLKSVDNKMSLLDYITRVAVIASRAEDEGENPPKHERFADLPEEMSPLNRVETESFDTVASDVGAFTRGLGITEKEAAVEDRAEGDKAGEVLSKFVSEAKQ
ncbi:forA, partial [Symbiodinium sp. KB8]